MISSIVFINRFTKFDNTFKILRFEDFLGLLYKYYNITEIIIYVKLKRILMVRYTSIKIYFDNSYLLLKLKEYNKCANDTEI